MWAPDHENPNGQVDVYFVNLEHITFAHRALTLSYYIGCMRGLHSECREFEKHVSKISLEELDEDLIQERLEKNLAERKRLVDAFNPNVSPVIQELFE